MKKTIPQDHLRVDVRSHLQKARNSLYLKAYNNLYCKIKTYITELTSSGKCKAKGTVHIHLSFVDTMAFRKYFKKFTVWTLSVLINKHSVPGK